MALENGQFEKFGSFGAVFPLKMTKLTRVRKKYLHGKEWSYSKNKNISEFDQNKNSPNTGQKEREYLCVYIMS